MRWMNCSYKNTSTACLQPPKMILGNMKCSLKTAHHNTVTTQDYLEGDAMEFKDKSVNESLITATPSNRSFNLM